MITVKIDEDTLLEMLLTRYEAWEKSKENIDLFEKMYQHYIDSGVFNDCDFDVNMIVDNDVVNYCNIVEKGDVDFDKLLKLAKNDEYDVSCEDFDEYKVNYIEAVSDDEERILIR